MSSRNFIAWLITIAILLTVLFYKEDVYAYILTNFVYRSEMVMQEVNEYKVEYDFAYIQNIEDFKPKNKKELLDVIYTIVNNGWDSYTFMCDMSYENCISDMRQLLNENYELANINDFVHPYNSYSQIYIRVDSFGFIKVELDKLYTDEEIQYMDAKVDQIYNSIITDNMTLYEKIKVIHDYIINNTKYLEETERDIYGELLFPLSSNKAYGLLANNVANCAGYTDTMAIFLHKLGVKNYKISNIIKPIDYSKTYHVWNLIYIDGSWKHLDLTWDDPVMISGKDVLSYDYFLVTSSTLENMS